MAFTIFYAWQMDRATNVNRWFVERAIKDAIRIVKREAKESQTADSPTLEPAIAIDPAESTAKDPEIDEQHDDIVVQWGAVGESPARTALYARSGG